MPALESSFSVDIASATRVHTGRLTVSAPADPAGEPMTGRMHAIVAGLIAVLAAPPAARGQVIGVVDADATVRQDSPTTNLGTRGQLVADAAAGRQAEVYLRVRVSGAGTGGVASALLRLTTANPSRAGSDSGGALHVTTCNWEEGSISWNGRPAYDAGVVSRVGAIAHKTRVAFDVTKVIQRDGVYCFALASESRSADDVVYQSREVAGAGPRVDLVLLPVSTTTTTTTTGTVATSTNTTTSSTTTSTIAVPTTTSTTTLATTSTAAPSTTVTSTTTTRTTTSTTTTRTTTSTTSTTTSPGSPIFACLSQSGPLITLTGILTTAYSNKALLPATRLDTRAATFLASPDNRYPMTVGGGAGLCLAGTTVLGQYDRTWSWSQMHTINNAGVAFANADATVDGVRIDNVTDGIRPQEGGGFTIRNIRMSYVRDDCVENDHLQDGLVEDSLLDGCYVAFSARPSPAIISSGFNGAGTVWTIARSLVRLQPMPGPDGGSPDGLGNAGFFKWHLWDDPARSLSPQLALHGNVFLAERVGQPGAGRMGIPPGQLVSCSENVMVWLGPGDFPAPLPPECFTITKDRSVWDAAVRDWITRHPERAD